MPIYMYECSCGKEFDEFHKINDRDDPTFCDCGNQAKRVISSSIFRDQPTWLNSACKVLQPDGEKPIESRGEFKRYLKDNNIVERG